MQTQILEQSKTLIPAYRRRYIFKLNEKQDWQYQLLIKGLGALPESEINKLDHEEKRSIVYRHDATWKVINKAKQTKMNDLLSSVLHKVFGNDLTGNLVPFLLDPITDNQFQILPCLKECNLTQEQIVNALINARILPVNFLN